SDSTNPAPVDQSAALSGGAMTVFDATSGAFSAPAPNLSAARLVEHASGDAQFEATFVTGGTVNGGLGPLYDNTSCRACHIGDGRGRPPLGTEQFETMLMRLSIAGQDAHGGPNPAPGFGRQLQARAVVGSTPEAIPQITYVEVPGTYGDGQTYSLRRPTYVLSSPYTTLPAGLLVSPRVAPAVFGLGMLEAVDQADILSRADPGDANGDGIHGHANYVYDPTTGMTSLGRFGWKASAANLLQQTLGAYNEDIGVTSSVLPAENCEGQSPACAPHTPDVSDSVTALVALYVRTLGVPARRAIGDPTALQGEQVFQSIGCAACHVATLHTGAAPETPEAANQTIHPYTDLLLHDMGPDLADGRPDYLATGQEWRTAPLWGIGLTLTVNGHELFLHDGRARGLAEAILWHGGEAQAARERFRTLSAADRSALVAFLRSL
ncbi:MAG TPA: di-heme oxidoredictase family protein, partial [Gemmatimonadales bacterium]|nr:di-heme oxidoredictase family protein [Gemmatimonadales bacterium]